MSKDEKIPLIKTTSSSTPTAQQTAVPITATSATATPLTAQTQSTSTTISTATTSTAKVTPSTSTNSKTAASTQEEPKKKQPPVLLREVKISNPDAIDHMKLLLELQKRFKAKFLKWKRRTEVFKLANLIVTLIIISIQVAQVIVFQLPTASIPTATKTAVATILPSVTSAVLAIQLKLGWSEKSTKCKRAAGMYNKLASHTEYRIDMLKCGGVFHDTTKIWNTALVSEASEIPSFLAAY
uniref:SMODS and SLOG-associating 2TM effector domain-containing protein n=1 Tax=Ciona savignyi TaxID=51511 RepID=H2YEA7_CIOSA